MPAGQRDDIDVLEREDGPVVWLACIGVFGLENRCFGDQHFDTIMERLYIIEKSLSTCLPRRESWELKN